MSKGVLQAKRDKAEKLLNQECRLQCAASSDPTTWSAQSLSLAVPNFITSKVDDQFLCDAECPIWVNSKICCHTVAVAEKCGQLAAFLHWYIRRPTSLC